MERDYSFNEQLRKEITAIAIVNKKIKMLEVHIDENILQKFDVDKEINTIQKAIRRRRQKNPDYRELFSRVKESKNLKIDLKYKIEALNQINSHIEEVKDEVKFKIKELKKKIINNPKENPFDSTEYVQKQKKWRGRSRFISRNSWRKHE